MDLESGAVVFVGDGKGAKALKPFWKRLRGSGAKIEAVAMDMLKAYREAVSTHLREAKIVFDRFHVVKLFNEKLSQLRRDLQREATEMLHKQVLKGTRWLLLKNPENLDEKRDEKRRLEEALAINKSLAVAYYMKEDLRQIWEQPGKGLRRRSSTTDQTGGGFRDQNAAADGQDVGDAPQWISAYYDVRITSGPMEGTNNKIKTMKRQAYGFRDREFLKLKILAIHETRYELVG